MSGSIQRMPFQQIFTASYHAPERARVVIILYRTGMVIPFSQTQIRKLVPTIAEIECDIPCLPALSRSLALPARGHRPPPKDQRPPR